MSLFNTLNTGASGLSVSGTGLAVIGDNIANLNSTGFKRNRATFADAFPNTVGTLGGIQKLGRGAVNARINTEFEQGMLQGTGSALDVAITGVGFFQVQSGNQNYYTRDGSFLLDNEGYMVTAQGMNLQGYNAVDGLLGGQIEDIQLDLGPFNPKATTEITLDSQLYPFQDFDPLAIDYQPIQATLDGLTTTMEEAASLADFSTSITVYDSLGRPHDVVLNFEQVAEDPVTQQTTWIYSAIVDAGETELPGGGSGTEGFALEIATGALEFDSNGNLITFAPGAAPNAGWIWPGAAPFDPILDFGLDALGNATDGSLLAAGAMDDTMMTGRGATTSIQQDGFTVGDLVGVQVDPDGIVRGQYTNGQDRVLAQVGLATFSAEGGLDRIGGNLYRSTLVSGDPAMGVPGSGSRGTTSGYTLERSNVDLEDEFVNLIQMQRSYQANAGVVSTADETLQELVQLV